jgi:hypothetical protein
VDSSQTVKTQGINYEVKRKQQYCVGILPLQDWRRKGKGDGRHVINYGETNRAPDTADF